METSMLVIFIGAAATIVGAVLGALVSKMYELDRVPFPLLSRPLTRKQRAISGSWQGKVNQAEGPDGTPIDFIFKMKLPIVRKKIKGTGFFTWEKKDIELELVGGYINESFLKLDYRDNDETVFRYGSIILEVTPDNRELKGRFVGFGTEKLGLIHGEVTMKKV